MTAQQETKVIYGNFIDGEWVDGPEIYAVLNKYTQEPFVYVSTANKELVDRAITSAVTAYKSSKFTVIERYEILMRAAELFQERKEEIARVISLEVGKPIKEARAEVDRGTQTFIASAEEAKRIVGDGMPIHGQPGNEDKMSLTIRVPVGVVCAITPFNFPFNLTAHKVAPAIAAGNAVVLKPAGQTAVSAMKMVEILMEAGLPKGLINVVNGSGSKLGPLLVEDERIDMYTFTGSPSVGKYIKNNTGIRKVTLELGNNSPNIIHHDVEDLQRAVNLCVTRGFTNAGQACIAVQRIYVHRDIYEETVELAKEITASLKVGNPEKEDTDVGPMISVAEAERAEKWIKEAVNHGAKVVIGGTREGAILQPTILTNVKEDMKVMCEEVFAPVINIVPYDEIDEVFALANDTNLGLQAGFFTSNLKLALRAAKELEFGGVNINDVSTFRADILPYGGVKDSGNGKEGPKYTIREMTEERLINIHI